MTILSADYYGLNSNLITACAKLGYIKGKVLDPTYGKGNWWKNGKPKSFVSGDLFTKADIKLDFTNLPFPDASFDTVTYDGPYKLNGTPTLAADSPYGVHTYTRWQDRMELLRAGIPECGRVLKRKGHLLVKCMDQVVSGQVRFQSDVLTRAAEDIGLVKVDEFQFLTTPREQPHDRQVHSRRNYSTLSVFQKLS